jgi:hypothetical protein
MLEGKSPRKEGSGSGGSIISQTPAPIRKDPNEEFFMMTFLSYKLNHKEYEKILATDGRALYLEVNAKKIPFYDWAKWIDEKFEKEWFDFKYRKTKRMMIVVQPKNIPEAVSIN